MPGLRRSRSSSLGVRLRHDPFPISFGSKVSYDCLGKDPKYVVMLGLVLDSSDVETEKKAVEESLKLEVGSDQRSIFVEGQWQ